MTPTTPAQPDSTLSYVHQRKAYVRKIYEDQIGERESRVQRARYYYDHLKRLLNFIVEPNRKVLQIECDIGHLLDAVHPAEGVGTHSHEGHLDIARKKFPDLHFQCQEPEQVEVDGAYDYVLLANAVGDIFDVQKTLEQARKACTADTRLVIVYTNYLWQPIIKLAERLNLKTRQPTLNWFSAGDLENLLTLTGFEVVKQYRTLLLPVRIPLVSWFFNVVLARIPLLDRLCYVKALTARRLPSLESGQPDYSVSVIVPCKDEVGNIEEAVTRIPNMGRHVEIIFSDDQSTDGTADKVREMQQKYPDKNIKLVDGPGVCKSLNVWTGFDAAEGDMLMILDADLTTLPEELPYFYAALAEGRGEFINGSRLVYPLAENAMKPLNVLGNKMFSNIFSYLLGQRIKDTLCGTKVMWRRDYYRMRTFRDTWGVMDRWGDYELIFSAAKLNLKIIDLPVHYAERVYGETKMTKRFKNAAVMARMCLAAFTRLRFA